MKGYYILIIKPQDENMSSGVWSKVQTQINTLNKADIETKLLTLNCYSKHLFGKINNKINKNLFVKNLPNDFFLNDFFYIRYMSFNIIPILGLIKKIKQRVGCRIIIEVPTYPYYKELDSGLLRIILLIDKIFNKQLKKYVDKVITFSKDQKIFNIPTIQIMNGIDCFNIPVRNRSFYDAKTFNLIAVAKFEKWHGYDRLIMGFKQYYEHEKSIKIYLHFVGDGSELNLYKEMVQRYNLSEYVIFYGVLLGDSLTDIYNKADVAICSLGSHRINLFLSSQLKSREYLARGLPMVASTKIDVLPNDYKYCLYTPEDESSVNLDLVVKFYHDLNKNNKIKEITSNIRKFAEENCDMSFTMKPVIDYLLRERIYK